ncbi:MAG: hypothetical protein Q4D89_02850 [Arachnia propionica]|uniref:ARPP-2 domain-containing protein n=1 Tax=Arachnia propionica TaxID=1750 RepID=UPI0027071A08|nr:hypothetical protein [Arachnia propionica]
MPEFGAPLELTGLTPAPSQVCGVFRLIPLLRDHDCDDLRLVDAGWEPGTRLVPDKDAVYVGFVPHAFHLEWGVTLGTQLKGRRDHGREGVLVHRQRKRLDSNRLRFLPQQMAIEALLTMHFNPPAIAWPELSESFMRNGLGCRAESFIDGHDVPGLEIALRTFEIHDRQVGMLVLVSDALAAAFVVPSPRDYRALHHTLLSSLYGDLVLAYACNQPTRWIIDPTPHFQDATTVAELRRGLESLRRDWAAATTDVLLGDWQDRELRTETVYSLPGMRLERFITSLELLQANHIGERIVRDDGELLHLNTLRLSAAQTRRAHLLSVLGEHQWHLDSAAQALDIDVPSLVARMDAQGFGHLINHNFREQAAKARRPGGR